MISPDTFKRGEVGAVGETECIAEQIADDVVPRVVVLTP